MIKRVNKYSKTEQSYINHQLHELKNNFPNFIIYEVYNQDRFQYIELIFSENLVDKIPTETNPWEAIQSETDFKRIFQIIANKFNMHYHRDIISIDYKHFIIKFKNHKPLTFFQSLNIDYNSNLKFIDNIVTTNIIIRKDKLLRLILSTIIDDKQLLMNKINIVAIDINQIKKIKHKYPLIDTNILSNFIIKWLYK